MRRIFVLIALLVMAVTASAGERWSAEKANAWSKDHPWPVGGNFSPSTAINQLEMWQADTFDLKTIDRELDWAEDLGFTSVRVFLHHLPYQQDASGFLARIDQFLATAAKHHIGVLFVPLDACWDPFPKSGLQHAPKPGLHNSGWVQCPGAEILKDPARHDELKPYIQGVIRHFRTDRRIDGWDLFNEPDNTNDSSYGRLEPANKRELCLALLEKAFAWAREIDPEQPLTSGVWTGDWSSDEKLSAMGRFQLDHSDVISFHCYDPLDKVKDRVASLKRYGRPLLCTEFMARPAGSTFDPILGYFHEQHIGAYCWGFIAGKTQTIYPWDSWKKPYAVEPKVWFHDILRPDGTPFDEKEVKYIKSVTGKH